MREQIERATLTYAPFGLGIILLLPVTSLAARAVTEPELGTSHDLLSLVPCDRHWLLPAWALAAECSWTEEGQLYQHRGIRHALRHLG